MSHQIRAEFAAIDQLAADQGSHAGSVEGFREAVRTAASVALGTLDGGMGTEQHQACMAKVDALIDAHIGATNDFRTSTHNVNDMMLSGGKQAETRLASG